ncbi:hypothetical protein OIU34_07395 [Pararhizobium sp. BT-229]|uniref:hypothetical protein n=1 Tax=Pararhizobium sp. BT-229 TaxID=2986923 RepID=UPI0021F7EC3A|nr:hypothetical protein [Pararhizobium sp. BT-229]MCV9961725.1 hypothetical protein [Pararhizobium sp. BT-229]
MNIFISKTKNVDGPDGLRNRFFSRKRMAAEDFKIEQRHLISRRRLVNRAVLGSGVVYGYALEGAGDKGFPCVCGEPSRPVEDAQPTQQSTQTGETGPIALNVLPGFALDRSGRELVLSEAVDVTADNAFLRVRVNGTWCPRAIDEALAAGKYVLAVHYAEFGVGEAVAASLCGCGDTERPHVCESVFFSLRRLEGEQCPCGDTDCPDGPDCRCDACENRRRGPHARLVDWATNREVTAVSTLFPWADHDVAVDDPVELACVEIVGQPVKCKPLMVTSIDARSPRRVVRTNDTLYDLINGCDLTHIADISWASWHRKRSRISWQEFSDFFTSEPAGEDSLLTNFTIRFSGPVLAQTIHRDVITMSVQMADGGTGWIRSRRLPLRDLDLAPSRSDLPPGTTDQIRVAVAKRWVRDEIEMDGESYLNERDFVVEIEIRGDLILDCSGQAVDANSIGLQAAPTGNGTPGGTYFSTFKVMRMTRPAQTGDDDGGR